MAKKKREEIKDDVSVDEKITETRKHLEDAEKRYQGLIEKRDELHEEGNLIKEERDNLHQQKRDMADKIKDLKEERTALVEKMRDHKSRRDQAHLGQVSLFGRLPNRFYLTAGI